MMCFPSLELNYKLFFVQQRYLCINTFVNINVINWITRNSKTDIMKIIEHFNLKAITDPTESCKTVLNSTKMYYNSA